MNKLNSQNVNGVIGEERTKSILSNEFVVITRSIDYDGVDCEVIPQDDNMDWYERIKIRGRIQAKFFENKNQVKIAEDYVSNDEGVRTEFFAFLHTNNTDDDEIYYFFTAEDIAKTFTLTNDGYFTFRLTKKHEKSFSKYLYKNGDGASKKKVASIIKEGIRKTEEFSNQKYLQKVEDKYKQKISSTIDYNKQLFEDIKNEHILDKIYLALSKYDYFNTMISGRVVNKLSFLGSQGERTTTYYDKSRIHTGNKDIIEFFDSIDTSTGVKIINPSFFEKTENTQYKIEKIVHTLNKNLIQILESSFPNDIRAFYIYDRHYSYKETYIHLFNDLCIAQAFEQINPINNQEIWKAMMEIYHSYYWLGDNEKILENIKEIGKKAKRQKNNVAYFISLVNARNCDMWNLYKYRDLDLEVELNTLILSDEDRVILRNIASGKYLNDCLTLINDNYLDIKELQQMSIVNDTDHLTDKIYYKCLEFMNFIEGNGIFITEMKSFKSLINKVIESHIISYSMTTEYSEQSKGFNYNLLIWTIKYCEPRELITFFQRNEVRYIPLTCKNVSVDSLLDNFFSEENIRLYNEGVFSYGNEKEHSVFKRKFIKTFENLCILLAYIEMDININILSEKIIVFIKNINIKPYSISYLGHLLVKKAEKLSQEDMIMWFNGIKDIQGIENEYILNICLSVMSYNKFVIPVSEFDIINKIRYMIFEKMNYIDLSLVFNVLPSEKEKLAIELINKIETNFSSEIYYDLVINGYLQDNQQLFNKYLKVYENRIEVNIRNQRYSLDFNSAYTNIARGVKHYIENIIEILLITNNSIFYKKDVIERISKLHPYYNFLINRDTSLPNNFRVEWILEFDSEIIMKELSKIEEVKKLIQDKLKLKYDKKLSKIYIRYFS